MGLTAMDGVLLVDKSKGPTSHDVVARVRRVLSQRSVGHAGTLDPMATGLIVIGVGEGTKLLAALTDDDKVYEAVIELGATTDTLDAEGAVTATAEVPPLDLEAVRAAVATFLGPHRQVAPIYSAIKRDGRTLHDRARRGEVVDAPVRDVVLHRADVHDLAQNRIHVTLACAKGFYVRSFARDLAEALGTLGHLVGLRRLESGGHRVDGAISYDELLGDGARDRVLARVRSMVDGVGTVPTRTLHARGLEDARHGRPIRLEDADDTTGLDPARRIALITPDRKLVALAYREGDLLRISRGFVEGQRAPAPPVVDTVEAPDEGSPCSE